MTLRKIPRFAPLRISIVLLCVASALFVSTPSFRATASLPTQIGDEEFWRMIGDFSEKDGFFRFENFLSNEEALQFVIPTLKATTKPGGVYLGVGPEQNFTYLAALQPGISFIIDIRRQNMIEHLMYKALFELSSDRSEFVSRLFSRKRPDGLSLASTPDELFRAYSAAQPSPLLFTENVEAINDHLTNKHEFPLNADDRESLKYVYSVFFEAGPDMDYSTGGGGYVGFGGRRMPNYADLMTATNKEGEASSFLASEDSFQLVREMQQKNLVIPLVGDFAGGKTIRRIGEYLIAHDATVTAFYLSNVEQYLFQQRDNWRLFYSNVATLPMDASSTFIRSASRGNFGPQPTYGSRFMSLLSSMTKVVDAFKRGDIRIYYDVLDMSN